MNDAIKIIIPAFILDAVLGDPQNPAHPVRLIGSVIASGVRLYLKLKIKNRILSFAFGMLLSLLVIFAAFFVTKAVIDFANQCNYWLGFGVQVVLCYFVIAAKALKTESMEVYRAILSEDLTKARRKLSYIVGRDTENLTPPQVITATVETVAENLSDGVIAPLFFVFIGGVPLGMAYKAVNTLDSMIGYKNDTYEYFGKFAARLDDAANLIPSRLAAILMIFASVFTKDDARQAIRIYCRDRYHHKSPNSAQTEAVCAGALGLRLGGTSLYKGVAVEKPVIGDARNEPEASHIPAAIRLMYATAVMAILLMAAAVLIRSILYV